MIKLVPAWCWWLLALVVVGAAQQYRVHGLQVDLADLRKVQIDEAAKLGACRTTRTTLLGQVIEQNDALADLRATAQARAVEVQALQQQAEGRAQQADKQALEVMQERTPPGAGACAAASVAFDDELKRERGL